MQPDVVLRRSNINDQKKASFLHEIHIYFGARLPAELEARHSALHMPSSTVHVSCYVTGKHLSSIWSKRKSDSAKFKKKIKISSLELLCTRSQNSGFFLLISCHLTSQPCLKCSCEVYLNSQWTQNPKKKKKKSSRDRETAWKKDRSRIRHLSGTALNHSRRLV